MIICPLNLFHSYFFRNNQFQKIEKTHGIFSHIAKWEKIPWEKFPTGKYKY